MDCILITKDTTIEQATNLVNTQIQNLPVEEVAGQFCDENLFRAPHVTFLEDGSFIVGLSIQEKKSVFAVMHRFMFHWSARDGKTDELISVDYGVLTP